MIERQDLQLVDLTDDMIEQANSYATGYFQQLGQWCDYFGVDTSRCRLKLLTFRIEQAMFSAHTLTSLDALVDNLRGTYQHRGLRIDHEGALVLVSIWLADDELRRVLRVARNEARAEAALGRAQRIEGAVGT